MIFIKKKKPFWQLSNGITQSFIGEWLACKERARLSYKEGWSSQTTSNALTFGTLTHGCLESIYKHIQVGKNTDGKGYIENTINFYLEEYKKLISAERLWTPEDQQILELNAGYLHILLPEYFHVYKEKDAGRKYLIVEEEFKNQWAGNIHLRGKIDIVYTLPDGSVWIMDHKTKYSFDDGTETRLSFDLQGMFYILNWWLKTGKLASGFVQNMIQRPRLRKKETESLKEFIERVRNDVNEGYFKRIQVTVSKEEFDYWFKKEFTPIMDEICGWANELLPNYRNPSACDTRYGSCKFIRVCGMKDFVGLYKRKLAFPELAL